MDADEALARRLQAEEVAAARAALHNLRGGASGEFSRQVLTSLHKVQSYEEEMSQAVAVSLMPLEQLEAAALEACAVSAAMGEHPALARDDALAQELLLWFKKDFFKWVDSPPCDSCGSSRTRSSAAVAPTAEEAAHGASRTELHRCDECGSTTRFPRCNDPVKLLETRRGRCGEWANCFTLCCRAVGLEARLVVDWGDHVWTEHWSQAGGRWVHLDPCEAAHDKPLLYEAGWGKQLSYVIAVGRHGVADVTRRYTRQYEQVLRRRVQVSEGWLADFLRTTTAHVRSQLPPEQRSRLEQRDEAERHQLLQAGSQPPPAADAALPGRQTGGAAWLAARGEDGGRAAAGTTASATAAAVPPPGTRYRLANDGRLQKAHSRRLCDGAVRASGEHLPGELAVCAFDGRLSTKWLDFAGKQGNAWLEYRLPAEHAAVVLAEYALTSANDCSERDPRHVVLEAWSEAAEAWVQLDEQRNLAFPGRRHRLLVRLGGVVPPSHRFRLRVVSVADPAAANSVQLACLELLKQEGQPPQQERQGEEPLQEEQQQQQLPQVQEQQQQEEEPLKQQQQQQQQQQEQPLEHQQRQQQGKQVQQQQAQQSSTQQKAAVEAITHQVAGLAAHQQHLSQEQPQPPQQPENQPAAPLPAAPGPADGTGSASEQPVNPWAALFRSENMG